MKPAFIKILLIVPLVCIVGCLIAQPPPSIPFQVVAKDPLGNPAKNRTIYVKDIIIQGSPTGTKVWEEAHITTSDNDGIYTIYIGKGTPTGVSSNNTIITDIGKIDWEHGPFFFNFKAAVAPSIPAPWWLAADNYVDYGTSQMLSVPFALFAGSASVTNVSQGIAPGPRGTFLITDTLGRVNWQLPSAANVNAPKVSIAKDPVFSGGQNAVIEANSTAVVTMDIPGAEIGDPVLVTAMGDYKNFNVYSSWVSGTGKVSIRFSNFQNIRVAVSGNLYKVVVIK